MQEIVIDGASNYLARSDGTLFNLKTGNIITGAKHGNGYLTVYLRMDCGKRKKFYMHRIICECFNSAKDGQTEVDHKNGIRDDNRIENLEWVTPSENTQRGYDRFNYRARPSSERSETIPYYSGVRTKRCGSGKHTDV